MTPKEKANELFYKMDMIIYTDQDNWKQQCKKCALIAVDEILNDYSYMQNVRNANSNQIHSQRVYWQEVKQEIEKL
jgi:hypothetical protein